MDDALLHIYIYMYIDRDPYEQPREPNRSGILTPV